MNPGTTHPTLIVPADKKILTDLEPNSLFSLRLPLLHPRSVPPRSDYASKMAIQKPEGSDHAPRNPLVSRL